MLHTSTILVIFLAIFPHLVTESGVHSSSHENCKTYAKFNLNVIYPPPYEREVWH